MASPKASPGLLRGRLLRGLVCGGLCLGSLISYFCTMSISRVAAVRLKNTFLDKSVLSKSVSRDKFGKLDKSVQGLQGLEQKLKSDPSLNYDSLRFSVMRIEAVASEFDWMLPFSMNEESVGLGSGFVVETDPEPLIVTNAHVVSDSPKVSVQLLIYGSEAWDARVVSICEHFDIAILKLADPVKFKKALKKKDMELQKLPLAKNTGVYPMGAEVVALGFPLGQNSLKISKGVIAGNQEVQGNICIQSTAPISPGNSGGPLLTWVPEAKGSKNGSDSKAKSSKGEHQVVGVNFAKATGSAENINYVIPVWRVQQMVKRHWHDVTVEKQAEEKEGPVSSGSEQASSDSEEQASDSEEEMSLEEGSDSSEEGDEDNDAGPVLQVSEKSVDSTVVKKPVTSLAAIEPNDIAGALAAGGGMLGEGGEKNSEQEDEHRVQIKIPSPEIVTIPASPALYKLYGKNCKRNRGVLITRISDRSFLKNADPPIKPLTFLTAVNGMELDEFGQGRNTKFVEDQVNYPDLFYMRENLFGQVSFETCGSGDSSQNANGNGEEESASSSTITQHTASLDWNASYDRGIQLISEPHFTIPEFEIFGGVSIMQMTVNHIEALVNAAGNVGLARWLHPDLVSTPRLIVNYVRGGTYAADILKPGSCITKVNGHEVKTLEEFRKHFMPERMGSSSSSSSTSSTSSSPALKEAASATAKKKEKKAAAATKSKKEKKPAAATKSKKEKKAPLINLARQDGDESENESSDSSEDFSDDYSDSESSSSENDKNYMMLLQQGGEDGHKESDDASGNDSSDASGNASDASDASDASGNVDLIWTLETDLGQLFATEFKPTLRDQLLMGTAQRYLISDTIIAAGIEMQLLNKGTKKASLLSAGSSGSSLTSAGTSLTNSLTNSLTGTFSSKNMSKDSASLSALAASVTRNTGDAWPAAFRKTEKHGDSRQYRADPLEVKEVQGKRRVLYSHHSAGLGDNAVSEYAEVEGLGLTF